jgi:FUN14 domain-containing protein 1
MKQYMSSKSFVNVDWKKLASSYDSTFGTKTSEGVINQPTIKGAGNWIIDFVTANFQRESQYSNAEVATAEMIERASFLAGLVLGVRLG